MQTTFIIDKQFEQHLGYELGKISIRVVVFKKRQEAAEPIEDDVPQDLLPLEDFTTGDSEVNSYLEFPKRGKMCCVFLINGQRQHGLDTRYGHQEDAAVGYNPHKRGRKSHHPLICVAARTRLCLHLEWRPGDTVSATDWRPAMEKLWRQPTIRERLWLNRGDVGFGQEAILAWHEVAGPKRPQYLFKLKLTNNVRRAIARVPWPLWAGANTVGFRGYCSGKAVVTELAARLVLLTYNLWSLFTRLMGLNPGHHTEAIKSRRNFLFLAAQVVQSGRQRAVKLAVKPDWWEVLKGCYQSLRTWLAATAPQLESQGNFLRLLARQTTDDPLEWLAQPSPNPSS